MVDYNEQAFKLTQKGLKYAEGLYNSLRHEQKTLLRLFKRKMQQTQLRELLKYVYEQYDEMTEKSQIKEKVLANRKPKY